LHPLPPLLELDRTENPLRDEILATPLQIAGGYVKVPEGPGLGVEVDEKAIKMHVGCGTPRQVFS